MNSTYRINSGATLLDNKKALKPSHHLIGNHSGGQIYPNIGDFVMLWSWMDSQIKLDKHIWDSQIKLDKKYWYFGPARTLASKISEFWTYLNPCVKDFRILDLPEPLRQRFQNFGPVWPTNMGAKYFQEFGPIFWGMTHKWIWIWIYPVCDSMGYPFNKGEGYPDVTTNSPTKGG